MGLSAESTQLSAARQFVQRAAAAFGLGARSTYEFVYAVNEAVTNAIRHGAPDEDGLIHLSVAADSHLLTITVRDCGTFAPSLAQPLADCEHGRGMALMARFTDELSLSVSPGATVVRLSKARA